MTPFLRNMLVVARRDFLAIVATPTFLLFLLAPLFMIGVETARLAALPTVCVAPSVTAPRRSPSPTSESVTVWPAIRRLPSRRTTSELSANLAWFSLSPPFSAVRSMTLMPAFSSCVR